MSQRTRRILELAKEMPSQDDIYETDCFSSYNIQDLDIVYLDELSTVDNVSTRITNENLLPAAHWNSVITAELAPGTSSMCFETQNISPGNGDGCQSCLVTDEVISKSSPQNVQETIYLDNGTLTGMHRVLETDLNTTGKCSNSLLSILNEEEEEAENSNIDDIHEQVKSSMDEMDLNREEDEVRISNTLEVHEEAQLVNQEQHNENDDNMAIIIGTRNCSHWKKIKNQKLRMMGKRYLGYTRKENKIEQNKFRDERRMGPTCTSVLCKKTSERKCSLFTEHARQDIFSHFWSKMNWAQRKVFVASHVSKKPTIRKSTEGDSRREGTLWYSLPLYNEKQPVCKVMFLNTLQLGSKCVQSWVNNSEYCMTASSPVKTNSRKKAFQSDMDYLDNFFKGLPVLPSHYSRKDTSKFYLEPTFSGMTDLMNVYIEKCRSESRKPLSRQVFSREIKKKKICIYTPKKDKCDVCVSYEMGNLREEDWNIHFQKKERAREEKSIDKVQAIEGDCVLLSMDLQAVKVCPMLNASATFFKTKLCCYNFTLVSHHCVCYWFTEAETDLVASVFCSCLVDYIEQYCINEIKLPIIIYSDGCTYQNRNNVMSNALLNCAIKNNVTIYQKFLERGHTQMECDSVHACIEKKLKHKEIYLPSDY